MRVPPELEDVLAIDPNVVHGQVCFRGTRVPLTVLLDNMAEGMGVDEFIAEYPSVTKEQAQAVVAWEQDQLRSAVGLLAS